MQKISAQSATYYPSSKVKKSADSAIDLLKRKLMEPLAEREKCFQKRLFRTKSFPFNSRLWKHTGFPTAVIPRSTGNFSVLHIRIR